MEKALEESKTLEKLTLSDAGGATLPRVFFRHVLLGSRRNTSLSKLNLNFSPWNWDCPTDGRLVYVCHMLCDSVGCSVYILCNNKVWWGYICEVTEVRVYHTSANFCDQ